MSQARRGILTLWMGALVVAAGLAAQSGPAADIQPKTVLDFEQMPEIEGLRPASENVTLDMVQDNCVTSGKYCLRVVGKAGQPWAAIVLKDPARLADFEKYDFLGLDMYSAEEAPISLTLEFFDKDSTDYYTRATLEPKQVHPGMNHLFWRIDRVKRNNKEGLDWAELASKDKIDRANLTEVKLYFTPLPTAGDTTLWMDNLRLLPENQVGGKTQVALPAGAIGCKFGSPFYSPAGFACVRAGDCIGVGTVETGGEWPDTLTGNGLYCPAGDFTFATNVPPGEYWAWVSASKIFNPDMLDLPFALQVGGVKLVDEKDTEREFYGEKGVFRYLRTQYSERPDALWLDYALPEAQAFTCKVKIADAPLQVRVCNMRLSAMVLMPARDEAGFRKLCDDIRAARVKYFYERTFVKKQTKPARPAGAGAYSLWTPKPSETVRPWSAPPAGASDGALAWRGAPGERLIQCLCVTPWQDLGTGALAISDLQGPATLPASSVRAYYMNYRYQDASVEEMALLPWTKIRFEPQITWEYWLWVKIPDNAAPGDYRATVTFTPDQGGVKKIPVLLTVYPFHLVDKLPVSYGMYYSPWDLPFKEAPEGYKSVDAFALALATEQFKFMREIGFTSTTLPAPFVYEWNLRTEQAKPYWEAAKAAGIGQNADQPLMTSQLAIARRIGRDMFHDMDEKKYGYGYVDHNSGVEFTLPGFRSAYMKIMKLYKAWIDSMGLPVAMEVIDEPREVPNPWNRTRDETIRYADWLHELGFNTFVTFMGDENHGKDYTPIVDHIDIASVHAWAASRRTINMAQKSGKTLWFYNTGMDRLSWGFYSWAMGAKGRWEWHFCSPGQGGVEGFPNPREWYTPFTPLSGYANQAPYFDFPGGMTFKSAFFSASEGITDYAYVCTLERAIAAHGGDRDKTKIVAEASQFLADVKKAIPEYPGIQKMNGSDAGALVGAGLDTPVAQMTARWRGRIAELLAQLNGQTKGAVN